jgi:hypothetical protein
MNERIEKLWDEAADSIAAIPNGRNNFWETQENFMEKFAELIVKDTMQVVANQLPSNVYLDVANAVIEHYKEN